MRFILLVMLAVAGTANGTEPSQEIETALQERWAKEFKQRKRFTYPSLPITDGAKVGDFGTINTNGTLLQKLENRKGLVMLKRYLPSSGGGTFNGFALSRGVYSTGGGGVEDVGPFMFKEVDISKLADDAEMPLKGVFKVVGTETYVNANGIPNTVLVVSPANAPALPTGASAFLAKPRTWTDSTGVHKVEATFVSNEKGVIHLEGADGKAIELPLTRLSRDDQTYVRELIKQDREYEKGK